MKEITAKPLSKDEWIQQAKALMFDCEFSLDSSGLKRECKELIQLGGGYNYMIESSETPLQWSNTEEVTLTPREIIAAGQDGKKIGMYPKKSKGESTYSPLTWDDETGLVDNAGIKIGISQKYIYKIIEEPREFWINEYTGGRRGVGHSTKDMADRSAIGNDRIRCIHYREVIEDEEN